MVAISKKQDEGKPRFLNHYEFVWDGHEWQIPEVGALWLVMVVLNPSYRFTFDLYDEFGLFPGLYTLGAAERWIIRSSRYCIVPVNPKPLFLRKWLDHWIDLNGCRIAQHVYTTIRLRLRREGVRDGDADRRGEKRAEELRTAFEKLYLERVLLQRPQAYG